MHCNALNVLVVRNRRAEEKADSEHKRLLEQILEKICSEVQYEMTAKGSKKADDVLVSDLEHVTHSSTKINSDLSTLVFNGISKINCTGLKKQ